MIHELRIADGFSLFGRLFLDFLSFHLRLFVVVIFQLAELMVELTGVLLVHLMTSCNHKDVLETPSIAAEGPVYDDGQQYGGRGAFVDFNYERFILGVVELGLVLKGIEGQDLNLTFH